VAWPRRHTTLFSSTWLYRYSESDWRLPLCWPVLGLTAFSLLVLSCIVLAGFADGLLGEISLLLVFLPSQFSPGFLPPFRRILWCMIDYTARLPRITTRTQPASQSYQPQPPKAEPPQVPPLPRRAYSRLTCLTAGSPRPSPKLQAEAFFLHSTFRQDETTTPPKCSPTRQHADLTHSPAISSLAVLHHALHTAPENPWLP
jgi:hypothetical protein